MKIFANPLFLFRLLGMIVTFLSIPWYIKQLGLANFGSISFIFSVMASMMLWSMGSDQFLSSNAQKITKSDFIKTRNAVFVLSLFASVSSFLIIYFFWKSSNIKIFSIIWISFSMIPDIISYSVSSVFQGRGNLWKFSITQFWLSSGPYILGLLEPLLGGYEINNFLLLAGISRWILIFLLFGLKFEEGESHYEKWKMYKTWGSLSSMIGSFWNFFDKAILERFVGPGGVAIYAIAQAIAMRSFFLPSVFAQSLIYLISGDKKEGIKIVKKKTKNLFFLQTIFLFLLVAISPWLIPFWLHNQIVGEKVLPLLFIMLFAVWINSPSWIWHHFLVAQGRPDIFSKFYIKQSLFWIPLTFFGILTFGVMGATVLWSCRILMDSFYAYYLFKNRNKLFFGEQF